MMKRILCCMYIALSMGEVQATTICEQYLQAHNAYAQSNYQEAVELLSGLPQDCVPVLYNLGWAQYKNGDPYEALKCFFKAARSASGIERVRAYGMYEQMQQELGIYTSENVYIKKMRQLSWYVPTLLLQCMLIFLLVIAILLNIYKKRTLFYVALLCAGAMTLLVYNRYIERTAPIAFAKLNKTILYTGPNTTYGTIITVPQGTYFSIVSQHDLWYCVSFDHQRGWIPAKDVDLVV